LFQVQGGAPPPPACFKTCVAGSPCTTRLGLTGECVNSNDGPVCLSSSPLNGPCGNEANAQCADTPLCATLTVPDGPPVSLCARICTPATPATCAQNGLPPEACGCGTDGVLACSNDIALQGGDGFCAPATDVGDTCGLDATTGANLLCTGEQDCTLAAGAQTGTCAAGEGEGEGE
jgi:hypothetical protein